MNHNNIDENLLIQNIIDKGFGLRKLLQNKKYHNSKESIKKIKTIGEGENIIIDDPLDALKEPNIRNQLKIIAQQLVENPNILFIDHYETKVRANDWKTLLKKKTEYNEEGEIILDARSRPGHKILDHHMTHFYDVKNYKGISVRGLVSQELLEKALMQNLSMHSTPYKSEIRRMIMMTGGLGSITKYRTITSKAIISYFNAKRVLDPCTGWGGRMLGSLASSSDTYYVGCEPDPNTAKGLRNILIDEAIPKEVSARAIIIEKPAEIGLNEIEKMDKFDLILTSPPYFNLELYTAGEQSTNQYLTWDVWVEKWLKVVILKCLSCLKEDGGVSCWSVKNFKSDKKYPLADVTKKIHEDAGWELIKIVKMTGSARPGKAKEVTDEQKKKKESEEETFCFRRKNI